MRILLSVRRSLCIYIPCLAILASGGSSCVNTRQLTYLQGSFDTARLSQIVLKEPVIQKADLLGIVVYSDNPAATAIFNQGQQGGSPAAGGGAADATSGISSTTSAGGGGGSTSSASGFLVDERGNIEFPVFGLIHVDGITKAQLKDTLDSRLKEFLKNPYCTVRFLNYKFTMLGEVNRPGIFSIPGEHINLLEALGISGDLTFFGRRDNILVIRDNNGKREWGRMDLTRPDVMASPFFNLQPNDVVYVEANKKKIAANDQTLVRNISLTATIISVFAIIYSIFR
jgi:polysaccharide export outer membrane protein